MKRVVLVAVVALAGLGAAAPSASPPLKQIAPGVKIGGVAVGGLTAEPARARVLARYMRPLRFEYQRTSWRLPVEKLHVRVYVQSAVTRALRATPRREIGLYVGVRREAIGRYVSSLNKRIRKPARNAELVGLTGVRPLIKEAVPGLQVDRETMIDRIDGRLRSGDRKRIHLRVRHVEPTVTTANFGPIIVIERGSNKLLLYQGTALERTFSVATGRAEYPTPVGRWEIVTKQRNPWWYPPDSDWAQGAQPIPPGPGNPLGTRWMGTSAPGVGIHATPDDASIGYSASHGCVRMHVWEAEWLYDRIDIGTPVFVVDA